MLNGCLMLLKLSIIRKFEFCKARPVSYFLALLAAIPKFLASLKIDVALAAVVCFAC